MLFALLSATLPSSRAAGDPHAADLPVVEALPPLPTASVIPELSFSNPFSKYEQGVIPGWQYGGAATMTNDYVSLTPASANQIGWIWSANPIKLPAWEVQLDFHIGGLSDRGAGGGMAFWFTNQQGRSGPIYGHDDSYQGLGVIFDFYEADLSRGETSEPFVVAMMNHGSP